MAVEIIEHIITFVCTASSIIKPLLKFQLKAIV